MSLEQQVMQHQLVQIIKNLKNNGFEDFTTEDVSVLNSKGGKLKVRFYTEQKWLENPAFKATVAQQVMNKSFKGCKLPDHVVTFEGIQYLVKVIK